MKKTTLKLFAVILFTFSLLFSTGGPTQGSEKNINTYRNQPRVEKKAVKPAQGGTEGQQQQKVETGIREAPNERCGKYIQQDCAAQGKKCMGYIVSPERQYELKDYFCQ